jgi:hypothetical protein
LKESENIYRSRSIDNGRWLNRVAKIDQELIDHAALPGKIDGCIDYINPKGNSGFIKSVNDDQFFFMSREIIEGDKDKKIMVGKKVRFYPTNIEEDKFAVLVEIL